MVKLDVTHINKSIYSRAVFVFKIINEWKEIRLVNLIKTFRGFDLPEF